MKRLEPSKKVEYVWVRVGLSEGERKANKNEILRMIREPGCIATIEADFVVFFRTGTPEIHALTRKSV